MGKDIKTIEEQLNTDFSSLCDWFIDNKLSVHLGCILEDNLSGESMATKVLSLVNNRLKFLYWKQKFVTLPLHNLLCNSLILSHYDSACSAWYPSLNKRLSLKKIQTSQNKCIRFCLKLDNKAHVGINEFIKIN